MTFLSRNALKLIGVGILFGASISTSAAAPSGDLMLFTSIPQDIITGIKNDFVKVYPDVKLEIFQGGAPKLMSRIQFERSSPSGLTADLIWMPDPVSMADLKQANILRKFKSDEDDNLPLGKDPDGFYYSARLMTVVIAYNTNRVVGDDVPTTWADLLSPRFKGKIAIPDPLKSGTAFDALAALSEKFGWDYFTKLFENGVIIAEQNQDVITVMVEKGYDVGITLDYMIRSSRKKGDPVALVYPNDGFVVVPSPISITSSSKNLEAAQAFMDFILSKDGQEKMVKLGDFLPARSDVYPPEGAPTVERVLKDQFPVMWEDLGKNMLRIKGQYFDLMKRYRYYSEEMED